MDLTDKIADELQKHVGYQHPITSSELARLFDIDDGDTFARTRSLVKKAIERYNLPIGSQTSGELAGYFIIDSDKILEDKYNSLMRRAKNIQKRAETIVNNYISATGRTPDFYK